METNTASTPSSNRIHPLVATAAVSFTLVSLVGIAAITGLLPNSHSTTAPAASSASQPAAVTTPAATANSLADQKLAATEPEQAEKTEPKIVKKAPKPVKHHQPTHTARSSHAQENVSYSAPVAQVPQICTSCGRVESVQAIQQQAQPSGVGVVAGAVLGGVLGHQVGGGNGKKLATVAGAVGGGFAGNEIEKRTRATTTYHVRVRMDDGSVRSFPYASDSGWHAGDRVKVVNGTLATMG